MQVFFGTVNRSAPVRKGGEVVRVDWDTKKVVASVPVFPDNPSLDHDPNPRGNTRGCRGLALVGGELYASTYHTVSVYDLDLRPVRDVSHGLMVGLHEVEAVGADRLWVTSTALDAALEYDMTTGALHRSHWPRELEHLVTVPAGHGPAPDTELTLPFELLLGSAAAVREHRPPVLAELLARHPMSGPDRTPLRATAAAEQVRLLHTVERGRLRVTVVGRGEGARTLGLVTWVLYADGWRALVPATADGVAVVHVVSTDPGALGAAVARLVIGAQASATRP